MPEMEIMTYRLRTRRIITFRKFTAGETVISKMRQAIQSAASFTLGMISYEDPGNLTGGIFLQKRLPVLNPFLFGQFDFGFFCCELPGNLHDPGLVRLKGSILCARQGWFFM